MSSKPSRTLLITPSYVIQNSPINSNVEEKLITQAIRRAEDIYIMSIIGSNLYQKIISLISGGTMTSGVYKTVLDDYISVALVDYATLVYIDFTATKFRNKGLQKQNSGENSEPASQEDLVQMKDSIRTSAQFYSERLIKYLQANIQDYPEYYQYTTIDNITPARSDYFSGVQFPKSNRGGCSTFGMGLGTDINI